MLYGTNPELAIYLDNRKLQCLSLLKVSCVLLTIIRRQSNIRILRQSLAGAINKNTSMKEKSVENEENEKCIGQLGQFKVIIVFVIIGYNWKFMLGDFFVKNTKDIFSTIRCLAAIRRNERGNRG